MPPFTVRIAGVSIAVTPCFPGAAGPFAGYLWDGAAQFAVSVTPEALEKERAAASAMARKYPYLFGPLDGPELEGLSVYHQIAEGLINYDALVFHGSAVALDGAGYVFTAPSGTGKSTHTRLWRQQFGPRAVMVNDDRPVLKFEADRVLVCGAPWMGKAKLGENITVPLKAVCVLERGAENAVEPLSPAEAYPKLLRQSYQAGTEAYQTRLLALLDRLVRAAELYRLTCNMDPEAALVAYRGMGGK